MSLINAPSPHTRERTDTGAVMRRVILATLPGLAVLVWQWHHIEQDAQTKAWIADENDST